MKYIEVNGIKSVHKKFDPVCHSKHDPAKYKAINYFNELGFNAYENPNKHGVDLIVNTTNDYFYCEVEVKNNWTDYIFPFDDVHVLARKKKYFSLDKPTCMMMLNQKWNRALILKSNDIIQCPLKEIKNKRVKEGEYFFIVPTNKAKFVNIK